MVMTRQFYEVLHEVMTSVFPIIAVVLLLQVAVIGSTLPEIATFLLSAVMVSFGFSFFLMGVKMGMLPMGESIGADLPKHGSIIFIVIATFFLSFLVTIAEPDVRVLTTVVDSVSGQEVSRGGLIFVIAFGVAFFMVVSVLRIIYNVSLRYLFGAGYLLVILTSLFVPSQYLAISYDAGGVTTGPMTVPVILALGLGITAVLGGRSALSDGFGLIGLASIGPILGVMLMGVFQI
jgi:hypothetical protein